MSEEQAPDNPWRVAPGALFRRLDQFIARVGQLQGVFTAAAQFMRLDRVEIGSTKVARIDGKTPADLRISDVRKTVRSGVGSIC